MTSDGKTQLRAKILIAEFLSSKEKIRVDSWNVRTLLKTNKLAQVVTQMDMQVQNRRDQNKFSEAIWKGQGVLKEISGHNMIPKDKKCRRNNAHHVRQYSESNKRVLAIERRTCHGYIYLQVHQTHHHHKLEPKKDAEEEKKSVFCDKYVLFVIEDFNTHGDNDSEFNNKIMG